MKKFKVGDLVRPISGADRDFSVKDIVLKIININKDGDGNTMIDVSIVYSEDKWIIGDRYKHLSPKKYRKINESRVNKLYQSGDYMIYFDEAGHRWVSKCCGENFDPEKGLMMCLCKKAGYKYSDIKEILDTMQVFKKPVRKVKKSVREVKREAHVGEYVGKIHKYLGGEFYHSDKPHKVINESSRCGIDYITVNSPHGFIHLTEDEYIVLEGYSE